ncbi:hypothetical protein EDC01DRAFT_756604 [Geopyxis carbonaria]|nr:hypothetical protein EDC01DRAFT_756604 [Geopyxis carbonaria]
MGVAKMANRELAKLAVEKVAIDTERAAMAEERAALEERCKDIELADAHVRRFATQALLLDNILEENLDTLKEQVVARALELIHHGKRVTAEEDLLEGEREKLRRAKREFEVQMLREKQKLRRATRNFEIHRREVAEKLCILNIKMEGRILREDISDESLEEVVKGSCVDNTEKETRYKRHKLMDSQVTPAPVCSTAAANGPADIAPASVSSGTVTLEPVAVVIDTPLNEEYAATTLPAVMPAAVVASSPILDAVSDDPLAATVSAKVQNKTVFWIYAPQ